MNFNIYPTSWDLRYFQEIAHTGNLSRAAERLGVGQPTLSLSLKRLENNLGAKLFFAKKSWPYFNSRRPKAIARVQ